MDFLDGVCISHVLLVEVPNQFGSHLSCNALNGEDTLKSSNPDQLLLGGVSCITCQIWIHI